MDLDLGGLGKSLRALSVIEVRLLSMLKRDWSKVIEDDLEATGFLGIEKVLEARLSNIGSDFDLTRAWAGRSSSGIFSSSPRKLSRQKTGRSGNSFPGKYILNCNGLKVGFFRRGDMRPDCTFLKSDGALMIGRRGVLLLDMKLILLSGLA